MYKERWTFNFSMTSSGENTACENCGAHVAQRCLQAGYIIIYQDGLAKADFVFGESKFTKKLIRFTVTDRLQ